jgi:uncharacterized protein
MPNDNPYEERENKSFWNSTMGTITKITALLTAITGLILAVKPLLQTNNNGPTPKETVYSPTGTISITQPKSHSFTPPEIRDFLNASIDGNVSILEADLNLGINADITLNDDRTALGNAVLNNKPEIVKILLQHKADPNIKINGNSYMLIEAAYGGYSEVADLLIRHNANVNCRKQDGSGITPLMFACIQGNVNIVQKLINANADPNLKSMQQSTALDYANELPSPKKEQVIDILNSVGALSSH